MITATIEQLARTADRIKREMGDEQSFSYEFRHDDDWNEALRGHPFTCLLWVRFRTYDDARRVYEETIERRQRWDAQRTMLYEQLAEMKQDPDALLATLAAYRDVKDGIEVLNEALSDPHGIVAELKETMERERDRWAQLWRQFGADQREYKHLKSLSPDGIQLEMRGEYWAALRALEARQKQYTAPRGG